MPDFLGNVFGWMLVVFIFAVMIIATFKDFLFAPRNIMCIGCYKVFMPKRFEKCNFLCDDCKAKVEDDDTR